MMNKKENLERLEKKMSQDKKLPLRNGATNLVFGAGSSEAEVVFIGEGPGYWEDQKAEPFVGNAGKLLDSLLIASGLKREDIFITNVVHHRPPGNRDPLPSELEAYGKYLDGIIKIIDPKAVVTLGRFSMAKFLPNAKITSVHGRRFTVNWEGKDLIVIPMYHPAAGLRSMDVKQKLIDDFKNLPVLIAEEGKEEKKEIEIDKKKFEQMNLI